MKHYIYTLSDPQTGLVRYVGKTTQPKRRLLRHIFNAKQGQKIHVSCWIRGLILKDMSPIMEIIDESEDDWEELERFYISYLRFCGTDLTNLTDGGEGTVGHKHTEESKRKISETQMGRKQSPESIEKTRAALKGIPKSEAHKEKLRQAHLGMGHTQETKDKISRLQTGKPRPSSFGEKMRIIMKGKTLSQEARDKISRSRIGKSLSDKTRSKMSASHTGTKYSPERLENSRRLRELRKLQKVVDKL